MGKAIVGGTGIFTSILVGAIIWFILQIIIGVTAWVSIVAGGVVALCGVLMALGVFGAQEVNKHRGHHGPVGSH